MPSHASASSHCGPYYWHEMWGTCGQIQTQSLLAVRTLLSYGIIHYRFRVSLDKQFLALWATVD